MKKMLAGLMVTGLITAMIGGNTFAWFSSTAKSADNNFQGGKISVAIADNSGSFTKNSENVVTKTFSVSGPLTPGQTVTTSGNNVPGPAIITIKNDGNLDEVVFKHFNIKSDDKNLQDSIVFKNLKVRWFNNENTAVLTENIITDYNFIDYATSYGPAAGNDGKLSLREYQTLGNGFAMGDWDFAALKPNSQWQLTFELVFDGPLATNNQQEATITTAFEGQATQIDHDAILALIGEGSGGLNIPNHDNIDTKQIQNQLALQPRS